MALRDLDIDIELDVDASGLAAVNAQIDAMINKIRSIPDDINIDVDLHDNGALAQIQLLQQQTGQIDNNTIDINAILDNAEIMAQLQALQQQINNVDNDDITIDVHTEYAETLAQLQHLEQQVNSLDADDIFIDVDIEAHTNDILALRAHLRMLELQARNINVDLDTAGAHAQLAILQAHINGIRGPDLNVGGGFNIGNILSPNLFGMGVKLTAILIALPAIASLAQVAVGALGSLGYALGVVATGALSLGSAVAVAGIGMVGFGALAISSITQLYEENAKLSAAQIELKKHTDSVVSSWKDMQQALQPITFSAIESGVKVVNSLLDHGQPVMKNATKAIDGLFQSLNQSLKGVEMQDFFSYLERAVGPLTTNLGKGLGNALKGVSNTMVALEPLTSWVGQGFENAMGRFAKWTAGAKDSDGFKSFMESTKTNLSSLGGILKNATQGIGKFFGAFDVSATDGLDWLEQKMKDFNKWAGELGENKGFQDMLNDIAHDGPEIAKTIGNVTDNVIALTEALADIGRNEDGSGGIWSWLSDLTDPDNMPEISFEDIFKGGALGLGLEALGIDIDWSKILGFDKISKSFGETMNGLGKWFDDIELSVGDWFKDLDFGGITRGLTDGLSSWFEGLDIGGKVSDAFGGMGDWFDGIESAVGNWFKGLDFGGMTRGLTDKVGQWFSNIDIGASISKAFSGLDFKSLIPDFKWPDFGKFDFKSLVPDFKWPDFSNFDFKSLVPNFKWPDFSGFDLKSLVPNFSWPNIGSFSWTSFISKFNWPAIGNFSWSSFISRFNWPNLSSFSWSSFISKFNWPKLSSFSWSSFISKFSWPKLPGFSWTSFISKFSWPKLPSFSWSSFIPKFSWPKISGVDLKSYVPGFSSGLGKVPQDMMATIHKDEAVLPADQAGLLRNLGVIQGDGRYPGLNLDAIASNSAGAAESNALSEPTVNPLAMPTVETTGVGTPNNTTTQVTNHNSVTIVVQGGGDAQSTATSVREEIENWFASVQDVMPPIMEV